jgi:hypothetical protein
MKDRVCSTLERFSKGLLLIQTAKTHFNILCGNNDSVFDIATFCCSSHLSVTLSTLLPVVTSHTIQMAIEIEIVYNMSTFLMYSQSWLLETLRQTVRPTYKSSTPEYIRSYILQRAKNSQYSWFLLK